VVDQYSSAFAEADKLEQMGRHNDAEQIRVKATLDLLSMVTGGVGIAKTAVTTLPKVAELGKIVAKGEGTGGTGHGIASGVTDAEAGLPLGWSGAYSKEIAGAQSQGFYDAMNPGSLPERHAVNFAGGRYEEVILTQSTEFVRVYGGKANLIGRDGTYVSMDTQVGGLQSAIDYAVNPAWGNDGSMVSRVVVPAGTKIYIGPAANQGGAWVGGKTQVYIAPGSSIEALP